MFSLLLAASLSVSAPQDNLCSDPRNCREVGDVEVQVGRQMMGFSVNDTVPFVSEDGLTLFVGESVVVLVADDGTLTVQSNGPAADIVTPEKLALAAAEMDAAFAGTGRDVAPASVNPVADGRPDRGLRISLMQVPGSEETVLLVENGDNRQIDYQAYMQVPGGNGAQYTTTCEVMPNLMVMEHWPHPIAIIHLSRFQEMPATGGTACD